MQENARTVPPGPDKETQEKTSKDKADELLEFEILTTHLTEMMVN